MEEDYNKHSDPNWAKFIDGKLDLPTAFWGFLVGGSIVLIAVFSLSMYVGFYSQDKITYTFWVFTFFLIVIVYGRALANTA